MNSHPRSTRPRTRRGFTLLELMISLFVVGVLLTIAYPSFVEQVRKSRRADAIAALTVVQQAQERWRANNPQYAKFNSAAAQDPANGLTVPSQSASRYYTLSIDGLSATTYTLVATAAADKSQAHDRNCQLIGARAVGGALRYGSGATSIDWGADNPDLGNCWAR